MSFGAYASNQSDWNFRKWLVPMLIASLLLHTILLIVFREKQLQNFSPVQRERLIPRPFNMKRAEVDPRTLQEAKLPEQHINKPNPEVTKLNSPSLKKGFEQALNEIHASPEAPDPTKPLINEKPKVDPATVTSAMSQMEARSAHALEREMEQLRKELTAQKPESLNQPALTAQGLTESASDPLAKASDISAKLPGSSAGPEVGEGGFSDIDELLGQTGPLAPDTAPLNFNSDTLYDYDSFILTDKAISGMTKLGKLIQKYPSSTFIIEGYTDTFGTPSYNRQLSLQRAESVKTWLVQNMGIDPSHVETRGLGASKLIVPATKSVEEQQPNRRVEIVIRTK